jgi:hypothetical protein
MKDKKRCRWAIEEPNSTYKLPDYSGVEVFLPAETIMIF